MKEGVTMTLSYQMASRKGKENLGRLGISGALLDGRRQLHLDRIGGE
jgi:hypothetical protein